MTASCKFPKFMLDIYMAVSTRVNLSLVCSIENFLAMFY